MPVRDPSRRVLGPRCHRLIVVAVERAIVETLGLEKDNRVVVFDRADQEPLGIVRVCRDDRLEPADVGEDGLRALTVRLSPEDPATARRAYGDGRSELARRPIAEPRCG